MKPLTYSASVRRFCPIGLSLLLLACSIGSATDPDASRLTGLYILTEVDGVPLPVPPPAPGSRDPCPPAITDGQFSLLQGPRSPQGYTISVVSTRACDPEGIPIDGTEVVHDAGLWSLDGSRISFASSPYNRNGNYQGTVETVSTVPTISVPLGGHTYTFRRLDPARANSGSVTVFVVDSQGMRVAGALMVFHSADGIVTRAFSGNAFDPLITDAAPGNEVISIAPPPGYTFAPGQPNPINATIVSEQITRVTVVLAKTAP